jgi:hypothetical protein
LIVEYIINLNKKIYINWQMNNIDTFIFSSAETLDVVAKNFSLENDETGGLNFQKIFENSEKKFQKFQNYNNLDNLYDDLSDLNLETIKLDQISVGDVIYVSYCPDSQKYLYDDEYRPFLGRVLFVDAERNDALFYYCTEDNKRVITSLNRPNCSYFGDHKGYGYYLRKSFKDFESKCKKRKTSQITQQHSEEFHNNNL